MDKRITPTKIVKRKLWQFGYSVRDLSGIAQAGFDLLVDGKFEVKVVFGKKKEFNPAGNQVTACVDALQNVEFIWDKGRSKSPYDIFGRKK